MKISLVSFTFWTFILSVLLSLIVGRGLRIPSPQFAQRGDTSIGPHSFDWMGAIALAGAVIICCFVD